MNTDHPTAEASPSPASYTVYKMHDSRDVVIYVGLTEHMSKRMRSHSEKHWYKEVSWVETTTFATREDAAAAEIEAIQTYRPKYNSAHNPDQINRPVLVPIEKARSRSRSVASPPDRRRRYVKMSEAADYLGVTDRTIRQMIADGRLTGYRSGTRLVRVDLNEIDQAMKAFGGGLK